MAASANGDAEPAAEELTARNSLRAVKLSPPYAARLLPTSPAAAAANDLAVLVARAELAHDAPLAQPCAQQQCVAAAGDAPAPSPSADSRQAAGSEAAAGASVGRTPTKAGPQDFVILRMVGQGAFGKVRVGGEGAAWWLWMHRSWERGGRGGRQLPPSSRPLSGNQQGWGWAATGAGRGRRLPAGAVCRCSKCVTSSTGASMP